MQIQVIEHIEVKNGTAFISGTNLKAKRAARMSLWEHTTIKVAALGGAGDESSL